MCLNPDGRRVFDALKSVFPDTWIRMDVPENKRKSTGLLPDNAVTDASSLIIRLTGMVYVFFWIH